MHYGSKHVAAAAKQARANMKKKRTVKAGPPLEKTPVSTFPVEKKPALKRR